MDMQGDSLDVKSSKAPSCRSSHQSSTSSAAVRARAKVEALKTRREFAHQEAALKAKEQQIANAMLLLEADKDLAMSEAEAKVLEAAAEEQDIGWYSSRDLGIPVSDPVVRVQEYLLTDADVFFPADGPTEPLEARFHPIAQPQFQPSIQASVQSPVGAPAQLPVQAPMRSPVEPQFQPAFRAPIQSPVEVTMQPPVQPEFQPAFRAPVQSPVEVTMQPPVQPEFQPTSQLPVRTQFQPHTQASVQLPVPPKVELNPNETPLLKENLNSISNMMVRKDLIRSGIRKFSGKISEFRAWKASFKQATKDLDLKAFQEMDLILDSLENEPRTLLVPIHGIHTDRPEVGLPRMWEFL
ncbi:uncharacterized protein [Antedon mediterranea]|uniref:uncharacterized protein n=1 Tax=Antedon mediterranea TaxID=105859 RepID=UPI003AF75768